LAGSVGTEVEEDRCVRPRPEPGPATNCDWLDELVGDPSLIATADSFDRIGCRLALSPYDRLEGALRPLPVLVPVHGVVPTADGRDALRGELGEIVSGTRPGRTDEQRITLYKSVGVAVEDAAAAALMLRAARERGVGREIEL